MPGAWRRRRRPDAYRDRSELAVSEALSAVSSSRLALQALTQQQMTTAYASTMIADSGDALGTADTSFTSLDAPVGSDDVMATVTSAMSDAGDLLTEVRIAVSRGRTADYAALVGRLDDLARQLDTLDGRLR